MGAQKANFFVAQTVTLIKCHLMEYLSVLILQLVEIFSMLPVDLNLVPCSINSFLEGRNEPAQQP